MKYKILIIFIGVFQFQIAAQNMYPVEIILRNNDTLKGEMAANNNFRFEGFILPSSFNEKVRFVSNDGNSRKINSKDILELNFKDRTGKTRKFVSINEYKNHLVEILYDGKVKWYRHFYYDTYHHTEKITNIYFDINRQQYTIGVFNSNKKKLKQLTNGYPSIKKYIKDHKMNTETILEVLKMYDNEL